MTAGRKAIAPAAQDKPVIDGELVMGEFAVAVKAELDAREEVVALAKELNYDGALTAGSLEDEIKFFQRRNVEAVLELGKRLLLLKQITGHGEFKARLESLGMSYSLAVQFMRATTKFTKVQSTALLALPNLNQGKLLELLILDTEEIEALESGETVRGVDLDTVDCMSVSELRTALRKAKREAEEEKAAQEEIRRRRDERISALEEENARLTAKPKKEKTPALLEAEALSFMNDHVMRVVAEIEAGLRSHFVKLERLFGDEPLPNHVRLAQQQALAQVIQAARVLAGGFGVTLKLEDNEPQELLWLTQAEALFGAARDAALAPPDDSLRDIAGEEE